MKKGVIFCVDDEKIVLNSLKTELKNAFGNTYIIETAESGIDNILTLYNNQIKQGIEVSKNYEDIPKILCYHEELNQVWTNILHNAIYAMDLNGTLAIKVYTESSYVVVAITDSGKGIPEQEIGQIFNPFFSTKPTGEGTGIGLDISKRIIEKHNGKIEVESKPGKTTFSVYLPIITNKEESTNLEE